MPMAAVPRFVSKILRSALTLLSQPALLAQWTAYLFLCYLAFYFAASMLLWFTIIQQQDDNAPPVALTWYTEPFGLGLDSAKAHMDLGGIETRLEDLQLIWPIDAPWRIIIKSTRAEADYKAMQISAVNFSIMQRVALPWTRAMKIAAQSLSIVDTTALVDNGAILVDAARLDIERSYVNTGVDTRPAEQWRFSTGSIILPLPSSRALQIEGVKVGVNVSRIQPDWADRNAVAAWQYKGSHIELVEATTKMLDLNLAMGGDLRLKDNLGLTGELNLQVSGIDRGFYRLGEMGLLDPRQLQMLGDVLRLMPDAGARAYTLPLKLKDRTLYIGPGPVYTFTSLPWDVMPEQ